MLSWQVKILADRLAIAYSRLEDFELDSFCEGEEGWPEFFKQEQHLLLTNNDAFNAKRTQCRKNGFYAPALEKVKEMLTSLIREKRRGNKSK